MRILILFVFLLSVILLACEQSNRSSEFATNTVHQSFGDDVAFLKKFLDVVVLKDDQGLGQIAVSAALQGRVMSSTSEGSKGTSYGWINKELFESGDTMKHINPYGGEERFWLGPEGGQFSIFFNANDPFDLAHWQTPKLIDLDQFEVKEQNSKSIVFQKSGALENYSGFIFNFRVERKIRVLSNAEISSALEIGPLSRVSSVAYQSTNELTNTGDTPWTEKDGALSIWLLGMFNPSDSTMVFIPYNNEGSLDEYPILKDDYFGEIPDDRLIMKEGMIYFLGDGKYRSKIGLSPIRAKNILGSFDSENSILTIVTYNKPLPDLPYVNSMWELQENPFDGDVINSYNDGPPEPGKKALGPFYELETSSPALFLKPAETGIHVQTTYHFEGSMQDLNSIVEKLFGVRLEEISSVFDEAK